MSSLDSIFGSSQHKEDGEHWLTVSDLMAGLMMVFLFIAIAFMRHVSIERDKIKDVAVAYQQNQVAIFDALNSEFENDLVSWQASIDKETLSFQFDSPEVLFASGESSLKVKFEQILSDFIPRYLHVLDKYQSSIDEVRIEGHTSSEWGVGTHPDDAYFFNMYLSQNRTGSVLNYSYFLSKLSSEQRAWIKSSFAAVGLASSHLKLNKDGTENKQKSRRVSFRVITNADIQIRKIVEGL
ncbi:flagellar motor protein MotB [Colwellia psychrerythraea]|uniref:OmpA/MotB domain protein n=1 Tax=Colwellia psychrerythraea TaxID=28229 RepID=A0A099L523_COLPS|nr:OmpA family protein [Colwellia psychrerythraea]KGJ97946.1 OmpA/MotB domain protein [Colwellia psychrerythraea]